MSPEIKKKTSALAVALCALALCNCGSDDRDSSPVGSIEAKTASVALRLSHMEVPLTDSLVLFPSDSMPPSAIPPTINATYASFICSSEVCDTQRFLYHLCLELSLI